MISRSASRSIAGGLASIGVQVLAQSYNRSAVAGTVRRPLRGLMHRSKPLSFNDLVCAGEQRRWDVEGKGLGSLR